MAKSYRTKRQKNKIFNQYRIFFDQAHYKTFFGRADSLALRRHAWFYAALVMCALLFSLSWYVIVKSSIVGQDYRQSQLERRIDELNAARQDLVVGLAGEEALIKIEEKALAIGLVPAVRPAYVALPASSLASLVGAEAPKQ